MKILKCFNCNKKVGEMEKGKILKSAGCICSECKKKFFMNKYEGIFGGIFK